MYPIWAPIYGLNFFANTTTASIKVTRNSSFIAAIQAFAVPNFIPSCSQLTEIGCIADNSTNGTVTLDLTSLTPGNMYFFRVFGVAHNASQRTGTFCFCGSTGLTQISLPVKLISFTATSSDKGIALKWTADQQQNGSFFEIEKSINGKKFITIGREPVIAASNSLVNYHFEENTSSTATTLYRLKMIDANGKFGYSGIVKVDSKNSRSGFNIKQDNINHRIIIYSDTDTEAEIYTLTGNKLAIYNVIKGNNSFYHELTPGMYIIRKKDTGETEKFAFYR